MKAAPALSPFPGLRPFEPDEDHLFFGRETEIDELLLRLHDTRFLCVVGASGSGKSSLVRCGLIPSLQTGFMVSAGSGWRVALLRPGEDPIGYLASALSAPKVLGTGQTLIGNDIQREATLRRSSLGLVEAVRQARLPSHDNLLVVVDQFEEIFRFRRSPGGGIPAADAEVFVKLLLEAARQEEVPIYIALTMRADFISDCLEYAGLPEAINAGQYLVPRMARDELRSAITGPVAVAGGEVTTRLVLRLLNDVGDDPDQLPVLQHALMRTWDYWVRNGQQDQAMDIPHYEAIGTLRDALSLHADEAYDEARTKASGQTVERVFKALTDKSTDSRGVRRPTSVHELAAICGCTEGEVISIVEVFRRPGRSFLMPPSVVPLTSDSIIDLSHESLMRCWKRLIAWTEEERIAATSYERLAQAAAWNQEGTAGLWRDPELELGLAWKRKNQPTAAWARRYDPSFQRAMEFLDRSEAERSRLQAEEESERRKKLKYAWSVAAVLALLLVVSLGLSWIASNERARAEANLELAKRAVDESLSSAGKSVARVGGDAPQMEEFRRELLLKAKDFYSKFSEQKPDSKEFRAEVALSHFRLGDIHRLLQEPDDAVMEYKKAVEDLSGLVGEFPEDAKYRQLLANTYNWLGETQRSIDRYRPDSEQAYQSALRLQEELHREFPENTVYRQELARTHYNRGILRFDWLGETDDSDFREAIRLLKPLSEMSVLPEILSIQQDLARTYNNLARLLRRVGKGQEAQSFYEQAIQMHESMLRKDPQNREYNLELATFYNNLATLFEETGQLSQANQKNRQAIEHLELLARPLATLGQQLAQAQNVRGRILESQGMKTDAERAYEQSVKSFEALSRHAKSSDFHLMFGQALFNLAALQRDNRDFRGAAELLPRAASQHLAANAKTDLGYDYLLLAQVQLDLGARREAQEAAQNLLRLLPELAEAERQALNEGYLRIRDRLK